MKFNRKNLKIFFLGLLFVLSFSFLILPHIVYAQTTFEDYCTVTEADVAAGKAIRLNVGFSVPGIIYQSKVDGHYYAKDMGCYIGGFYKYFAGVGGILAAVMIIYGGYKYITSFGNASRMSDAKNTIYQALFGVVLLLASYVILYTINPNLISLQMPAIQQIGKNLLATQWCPDGAVPSTDQDSAKKCGDHGKISATATGGECHFRNCKQGEVCYQGDEYDPYSDIYNCGTPQQACEALQAHANDEIIRALCPTRSITDPASQVQLGQCSWYNELYWWPLNDRCNWLPKFTCRQGYHRADCSKCKEHNYVGNQCDFDGLRAVACVDNIDIYMGDASQVKAPIGGYKYATICCEADNLTGANSDYHCVRSNAVDTL